MKHRILLAASAVAILAGQPLLAQTTQGFGRGRITTMADAASAAPVEYRILDSLVNSFSYYSNGTEPFRYDPLTNILGTIMRGSTANPSSGHLYLRTSTDLGVTWSAKAGPLNDPTAAGSAVARYPSLLINPIESSDPAEALFYFTAPILSGTDASGAASFGGFTSGLVDKAGQSLLPVVNSLEGNGSQWGSDAKSVATKDHNAVLSTGRLDENSIGLRTFDLNTGTQTVKVPPQFATDAFRTVADPSTQTSVINVGLERDNAGAIYAAFFGETAASDPATEGFLPIISKSLDNGATWSTLDGMPGSVMRDYAASQGLRADSTFLTTPMDFALLGPDNYSFVTNLIESDADNPAPSENAHQIVEINRTGGTWSMRRIATTTGTWFTLINGANVGDTTNQLRNEIQISPTADGTKLVAKWVGITGYIFQDDITGDGAGPDTVTTSDVFVSIRSTSGDTWGTPLNVTESPMLDRHTWIPNIVPNDLGKLPLLSVQSILTDADALGIDQLINAQRLLVDRSQYIVISNVDATVAAGVNESPARDASGLAIGAIVPNPARSTASLAYEVAAFGPVSVRIIDALGVEVLAPVKGLIRTPGNYTVPVVLSGLPAGRYRVVVSQNGRTVSEALTVVH